MATPDIFSVFSPTAEDRRRAVCVDLDCLSNLIPRYLRCYRGYSPGLRSDLTLGTNPIPVVTAYCIA